jgi:hypothetical protein
MVLLDTEKTYDTVWLNSLLFKLISLHLPDYLFSSVKSCLKGCTFTIHLNNTTSTPKSTPSSISQGAILSTTLLSPYISGMLHPPHIHLTLYTYDMALLSNLWLPDTISRRLSTALTTLYTYNTTWKLNTHQTEAILFSNSIRGHLCTLGLGCPLSRPCATFKTSLHPAPVHCRQ